MYNWDGLEQDKTKGREASQEASSVIPMRNDKDWNPGEEEYMASGSTEEVDKNNQRGRKTNESK